MFVLLRCLVSAFSFKNTMNKLQLYLVFGLVTLCQSYTIDDSSGLGRRFDGIGGLSGGGVSICTNYRLLKAVLNLRLVLLFPHKL